MDNLTINHLKIFIEKFERTQKTGVTCTRALAEKGYRGASGTFYILASLPGVAGCKGIVQSRPDTLFMAAW
jgi:hypothetical protein